MKVEVIHEKSDAGKKNVVNLQKSTLTDCRHSKSSLKLLKIVCVCVCNCIQTHRNGRVHKNQTCLLLYTLRKNIYHYVAVHVGWGTAEGKANLVRGEIEIMGSIIGPPKVLYCRQLGCFWTGVFLYLHCIISGARFNNRGSTAECSPTSFLFCRPVLQLQCGCGCEKGGRLAQERHLKGLLQDTWVRKIAVETDC